MILALLLACAPSPPGVLIIVQDTTRADFGGAPDLDLTGEWRVYDHAYSAASYTTASAATIASGRYPEGDERLYPGGGPAPCGKDKRPPQRAAWPADAWPELVLTDQPVVALMAPGARKVGAWHGPGSAPLFTHAAASLDGYRAVLTHSAGAHDPYDGIKHGTLSAEAQAHREAVLCGATPAPEIAAWAVDAYQDAVLTSREGLAELVEAAQDRGFVIVVTADHGEALGEDGLWGHATSLHDAQVRVPLYVWGPGVEPYVDDRPISATCVGQTARVVLGDNTSGLCDLRDGTIGGDVVAGMLRADGTWDERVILAPAVAVTP